MRLFVLRPILFNKHHLAPLFTSATSIAAVIIALFSSNTFADDKYVNINVEPVYVDVYSGPAEGYPVFHTLERGQPVEILKSRTEWFKIRTLTRYQPIEGWVHRDELYPDGDNDWNKPSDSRWSWTTAVGSIEGAQSIDLTVNMRVSDNITIGATVGEASGDFSTLRYGYIRAYSDLPSLWSVTPYFTIGAGALDTQPNTQLVQVEDRLDSSMLAGIGLRAEMLRNFSARFEYNQHLVLTERDTNEDVTQWVFGLTVSF